MPGEQLRRWAREREMTGLQLAEARGIRPETVSRHMNDRTKMSDEDYAAYAALLNIEPADLSAEPILVPVFGVIDRQSFVHVRHATQQPLAVAAGPGGSLLSKSLAVLQPRQFAGYNHQADGDPAVTYSRLGIDDLQMDGMFMCHEPSLRAQEVSRNCLSRLCLVSAVIDHQERWIMGTLYQEPAVDAPAGTGNNNNFSYAVSPYWKSSDAGLITGLRVEAASPVLAKIYAPFVAGYRLIETQ